MTETPSQQPPDEETVQPKPPVDPEELRARSPEERRNTYIQYFLFALGFAIFAWKRPDLVRSIGLFVLVLGVLVLVHEWGHFQFARWAGMKVNRFALGFPPFIYTRHHKGIAYSIGALPIGGMVDIAGLGSEEEMVATAKGSEAAQPTRASRMTNLPRGQRQFQDANLFWRFMTLFAGPMMNFLFAMVVFIGVYSIAGEAQSVSITNQLEMVAPNQPADRAGLQSDDTIVGINGVKVSTPEQISNLVEKNGLNPLRVEVLRGTQKFQTVVTPRLDDKPVLEGKTIVERQKPMIGVQFVIREENFQRQSAVESVKKGWGQATFIVGQILDTLKRAVTGQLTRRETRDIGGPVKISQVVSQVAKHGWRDTALMMGALSVNLGLMNLLPIPALDGGRILFLLIGSAYEGITSRPIDPRKETYVHLAGMALLLMFMLFITFRDVLPLIARHLPA